MLADACDAPRLELLAQYHAEDGRLGRVLHIFFQQVRRRILRIDGDVQQVVLPRLAHGEDDRLLVRLGDFIDAAAREGSVQLAHQRAHGETVKTHNVHSFLCCL